ncbi:hypothetical protein SGLAM104S_05377 [Streptomyces glaucescens]
MAAADRGSRETGGPLRAGDVARRGEGGDGARSPLGLTGARDGAPYMRSLGIQEVRGCAVDPRTTSSGSKRSSLESVCVPWIWAHSSSTAARPIASIGCRTVDRGGSVQFMKAESSNPTTDTSAGTVSPSRRAARMAPNASGPLAQITPVTPRSQRRLAAAWPPSSENMERSTKSARSSVPADAAAVRAAVSFRRDGMWSSGPRTSPMRSCPRDERCRQACLDRHHVVAGDTGKVQTLDGRVDQHDGDVAFRQLPVVVVRGVRLGEQSAGEDHPGTPAAAAAGPRSPPRRRRPWSACTARA